MSKKTVKKFIDELGKNEELRAKVQGVSDLSETVKIAADMGYDLTIEELMKVDKELRREQSEKTDETVKELSADELGEAAGGLVWKGEDAPDGHEMGCAIFYHGYSYQFDKGLWCNKSYWCISNSIFVDTDSEDVKDCLHMVKY